MRKFYTLFLSLAVMAVSGSALAQTPAMKLLPATKTTKTEKQIKASKRKAQLETFAAKATVFPDSAITYGATGQIKSKVLLQFYPNGKIKDVESYELEGGKWIPNEKEYYAYDAKGNETLNEWYEWNDSINSWVGEYKYITGFDHKGQEILEEEYVWNGALNNWNTTPNYKTEKAFNTEGKLLSMISTNMGGSDSPIRKNQIINVYNEQSFLITSENTLWSDGDLESRNKYEYERDTYGNVTQLRTTSWDKTWGENPVEYTSIYKYTHSLDSNGRPVNSIDLSEDGFGGFSPVRKSNYAYDANNNVTYQEEFYKEWSENSDSLVWVLSLKKIAKYNDKGYKTFDEQLSFYTNSMYGYKTIKEYDDRFSEDETTLELSYEWNDSVDSWVLRSKSICLFNEVGDYLLDESYSGYNGKSIAPDYKDVWTYDKNGMMSTYKEYEWNGADWELAKYQIVYPYTTSTINVEEVRPIDQTGTDGKFELTLNIPSESTLTGSYTITLPQGFTLDQNATKLVDALTAGFGLTFTDKGNNSWLIEIKAKGTKSTASNIVLQKVMDVAYTVNVDVDATYEIKLSNIDFKLTNGGEVKQESLSVEVGVKTGLSINTDEVSAPQAYINNGTLFISSDVTETITIYTATGVTVFSAQKDAGELDVNGLPNGLLIVKGSTGWTAKVVK